MNYVPFICGIVFFTMPFLAQAEEIFPPECKPIMVKDETVFLSAKKPILVMLHNLSDLDLWITHPVVDGSASAGWSSHLQAGHWSALVLKDKSFELNCIESKPGHEQQIPCENVLAVCAWKKRSIPPHEETSTFWAGENMTLSRLKAYLGRRGFL